LFFYFVITSFTKRGGGLGKPQATFVNLRFPDKKLNKKRRGSGNPRFPENEE
jgi:hypothetical protein